MREAPRAKDWFGGYEVAFCFLFHNTIKLVAKFTRKEVCRASPFALEVLLVSVAAVLRFW